MSATFRVTHIWGVDRRQRRSATSRKSRRLAMRTLVVIGHARGLANGVGCAEWVPYEQGSVVSIGRRAFPAYPVSVLRPALHVTYLPQTCTVWKVPKAPAQQRAATPSTIPTRCSRAASTASRQRVGRG